MGVCVFLEKESESEVQVSYRYGPGRDRLLGLVRLDLVEERFVEIEQPGTRSVASEHQGARYAIVRARSAHERFPERLSYQA